MIENIPKDPFDLFNEWFAEAKSSEINDPDAMAVACRDEDGRPSVRMVLMKKHDERGFCFFTNRQSRKGKGLIKYPEAEACFHWKSTRKQIRITGKVEQTGEEESEAYAAARPRDSQIAAWASQQSEFMDSYDDLLTAVKETEKRFEGQENVPRPPHWGGFRIIPDRIEFWISHEYRMHHRFAYLKSGNDWKIQWLFP